MSRTDETRVDFLMTFFEGEPGYCEKCVNGFWLVKTQNGTTGKPVVMIFTQQSFRLYKQYSKAGSGLFG